MEAFAGPGSQEEDYARAQMANSVRAAVSALPPKFRIAVLLRYFEDLSYEQMAKALHCSMGTVASQAEPGTQDSGGAAEGSDRDKGIAMFTRHVSRQLAAHLDGQLAPPEARQVELHLAQCARCRAECEQVRLGMAILEHLPLVEAPDGDLGVDRGGASGTADAKTSSRDVGVWRSPQPWCWPCSAPRTGASRIRLGRDGKWCGSRARRRSARSHPGAGRIGAGEWIETDARSSATVKVGEIGSVEVAPNTRLRVVTARPGEHRLALARGEIRAKISAPPRLFFVDTASGTAVDLGCEYSLNTDEDGFGLLHVTKGWVSFQWQGSGVAGAGRRELPDATARRTGHSVLRRRAGESETGAGELRFRKSRERRAGRHPCRSPRARYAHALASALARGRRRSGARIRPHRRPDAGPGRSFARAGAQAGSRNAKTLERRVGLDVVSREENSRTRV